MKYTEHDAAKMRFVEEKEKERDDKACVFCHPRENTQRMNSSKGG